MIFGRGRHPRARQQRFEVLIGILGVFAAIAFVNAAAAELAGKPALAPVLVLVFFLAMLWLAVRAWRRIPIPRD